MGIVSFFKEAGEKLFGKGEAQAAQRCGDERIAQPAHRVRLGQIQQLLARLQAEIDILVRRLRQQADRLIDVTALFWVGQTDVPRLAAA